MYVLDQVMQPSHLMHASQNFDLGREKYDTFQQNIIATIMLKMELRLCAETKKILSAIFAEPLRGTLGGRLEFSSQSLPTLPPH